MQKKRIALEKEMWRAGATAYKVFLQQVSLQFVRPVVPIRREDLNPSVQSWSVLTAELTFLPPSAVQA